MFTICLFTFLCTQNVLAHVFQNPVNQICKCVFFSTSKAATGLRSQTEIDVTIRVLLNCCRTYGKTSLLFYFTEKLENVPFLVVIICREIHVRVQYYLSSKKMKANPNNMRQKDRLVSCFYQATKLVIVLHGAADF